MAANLTNKVFCLTGAAAGIGLSTARILLSRGAAVGISDIHEKNLRSAYDSLTESEKSRAMIYPSDVIDRAAVKEFIKSTKSRFGRVDGVANIAGTAGKSFGLRELWEVSSEEYDFVMDVNVRGTFNLLAESMVPGFLEPGSSIVNVGSVASARGYNKGALYPPSKHAVIGLTKSAAIEGGRRQIRVNAILPYVIIKLHPKVQLLTYHGYRGPTDTELLIQATEAFGGMKRPSASRPMQRTADVSEISSVIAFLLGPESTYVTGAVWAVDGGSLA